MSTHLHDSLDPALALLQYSLGTKHQLIETAKEFELTMIQANTLLLVEAAIPQPMNRFCKLYHCDASNVTGIIDGLEEKGLVRRSEDEHDRRIKVVLLEEKGQRLKQALLQRLYERMQEFWSPLSQSEKDELLRLMTKVGTTSFAAILAS